MSFYKIVCILFNLIFKLLYKLDVRNLNNVPLEGKIIICSNHVSLLDPLLLGSIIPRKLNYMAKKELFQNRLLGFLIKHLGAFPVDRDGGGLSAIKMSIKILNKDNVFAMFPQGRRVQDITDNSTKPGIGIIAVKAKSQIIPIYIDTKYKLFTNIIVTIGESLSFEEYYDQKLSTEQYKNLSELVLKKIYDLK